MAGLGIRYLGGVRYDNVETILVDPKTGERSYLIVRASGTEPLVRIYTEGPSEAKCKEIEREVLGTLERLYVEGVRTAASIYQLADMLIVTQPWGSVIDEVRSVVARLPALNGNSGVPVLAGLLKHMLKRPDQDRLKVEWRNRETLERWLDKIEPGWREMGG